MYWKSNIFFLAVLNICKTYSIYVIFSDSTKTASRNPWLNFLWEFSKCSRVFNITRNNIQYFGTKISQRFLSRNLQISLAATKNLFVKTVTYAVSFTDQLSIDITHAHEVWPFHDGFLKVLIIHSAWFGQTSNRVFWSEENRRYLSYELDLFFKVFEILGRFQRCNKKVRKNVLLYG